MIEKCKKYPRYINDTTFQKMSWRCRRNRVQLSMLGPNRGFSILNTGELLAWIEEHTIGNWHFKENFTSPKPGNCSKQPHYNITFWFELEEDVILFKLTWEK